MKSLLVIATLFLSFNGFAAKHELIYNKVEQLRTDDGFVEAPEIKEALKIHLRDNARSFRCVNGSGGGMPAENISHDFIIKLNSQKIVVEIEDNEERLRIVRLRYEEGTKVIREIYGVMVLDTVADSIVSYQNLLVAKKSESVNKGSILNPNIVEKKVESVKMMDSCKRK